MPNVKSHIFRGRRYNLKKISSSRLKAYNDNKRCIGLCDDPQSKNKTIYIDKELDDLNELDTYIHEALHCGFWDLEENAVQEFATDLAKFLWRLGYRKN